MITNFKTKIENNGGSKTLIIKYKDETIINWTEANQFVSKFIRQGWAVDRDYKCPITSETTIILSK